MPPLIQAVFKDKQFLDGDILFYTEPKRNR